MLNNDTWKAFGYSEEAMRRILTTQIHEDEWYCDPPVSADALDLWIVGHYCGAYLVYAIGCIGYSVSHAPLHDWKSIGRRVFSSAIFHFLGTWEGVKSPHWAAPDKSKVLWNDHYREGISIGAALREWDLVDQLLHWPSPDLRVDRGSFFHTQLDNFYQIWLAAKLRGEESSWLDSVEKQLLGAELPRVKNLAQCALALLKGDAHGLRRYLGDYLVYHAAEEVSKFRPDTVVSCDATLLWYFAERKGMSVSLPSKLLTHIANPAEREGSHADFR